MAVIAGQQVVIAWQEGTSSKVALIAVKNVTTGDTLDLGPTGATTQFRQLKAAVMLGATVIGSASASIAGTVITMPAGLSADAAWILAFGAAF
jgi:hypothetical protein